MIDLKFYTDGAYSPKRDKGGWAVYCPELDLRVCGTKKHTSSDEMEVIAIDKAIDLIRTLETVYVFTPYICSDSLYALESIFGDYMYITNVSYINSIKNKLKDKPKITKVKVKGHSTCEGNNIADNLAVIMTKNYN